MNNKIMDRSLWDTDFSKKTIISNWKQDKHTVTIAIIIVILLFLYTIVL